ncbi:hypothetical protein Rleg2_0741 [Rhizobium leguminosarum bv. trifolii WSM2304]|uniref:Phage tail protein n=1 Tax=Rhizobium leguminosarum bv. trifolii (strain WSM2304) TaxID=395492 RepID=A0ABF7QJA8_RHILW|nr:hypothetical protein [Rhizobium leguminosarum]ACI54037.1 hypothetical protein Rleg2_0741 [Rhizobium leguminosarum bv. trifolii WSM2304]
MPRNPSTGVYSKPAGTTPSVGQVIDPAPWNALTTDLGNEITNSLPRDGSAPMVAPLKAAGGTVSAPGVGFASTPQTGLYLKGGGLLGFAQNGVDVAFDQDLVYAVKPGDYTALASDDNAVHRFTAAATLTLSAAATLGANWHYCVIADGGDVTIDPNGAEMIDGAATLVIPNGYSTFIVCSGTAFFTDKLIAKIQAKSEINNVVGCETVYVSSTSIQIKTGEVFFNSKNVVYASALTKSLSNTFTAGNSGGFLDIGVMQASKTYFVHSVRNLTTGVGDWVASLQSVPALVSVANLTDWEVVGRVNVVLTTSGNAIRQYVQDGNEYRITAAVQEYNGSGIAATDIQPVGAPAGITSEIYWVLAVNSAANSSGELGAGADAVTSPVAVFNVNAGNTAQAGRVSARSRSRSTGIVTFYAITTVGSVSYTLRSSGFNDYTVPRLNGA